MNRTRLIGIGAAVLIVGGVAIAFAPDSEPAATASVPIEQTISVPAVPTSSPTGWTWEPLAVAPNQITSIPSHPNYGPTQTDPGDPAWRGGWSQTPLGALGAATQLQARTDISTRQAQTHFVEGPYKPAAIEFAQRGTTATRAGESPFLMAFRFNTFTPTTASVQLVYSSGPKFNVLVATTNLQWIDGDWRIEAGQERATVSSFEVPKTPSGFIDWQAPR